MRSHHLANRESCIVKPLLVITDMHDLVMYTPQGILPGQLKSLALETCRLAEHTSNKPIRIKRQGRHDVIDCKARQLSTVMMSRQLCDCKTMMLMVALTITLHGESKDIDMLIKKRHCYMIDMND